MSDEISSGKKDPGRIIDLIMNSAEVWQRKIRMWLRDYDLTEMQLGALMILSDKGSQTASQLGDGLRRARCTVTGVVDRLEKKSLVKRRRGLKDRRLVFVQLTENGEALAVRLRDEVLPQISQLRARAMGKLSDAEVVTLLDDLSKLSNGISDV